LLLRVKFRTTNPTTNNLLTLVMASVNLRESKEAGAKVQELGEQGALQSCTALNLEYGYNGARPPRRACRCAHARARILTAAAARVCAVGDDTLSIIGTKASSLVDLNLNACQECTGKQGSNRARSRDR
jgi:hypothetical protein